MYRNLDGQRLKKVSSYIVKKALNFIGGDKHTIHTTLSMYFAIEKCREMQLKMQRFATHLIPFRQCVGQSIALAMKRDDMGVMN
jgi:hypothetical protein